MNEEWLLHTVRYYQKLHFFEQYQNLSERELTDTVRGLSITYGGTHGLNEQQDWAVLMQDEQRVIKIASNLIYGDGLYLVNLDTALKDFKRIAQISRGVFFPKNVTAYYITFENEKIYDWENLINYLLGLSLEEQDSGRKHKAILEFELERVNYSVVVTDEEPSIVAGQINYLLKNTGHKFVLLSEECLMFLSQEEKQKIQSERGLKLYTVKPRVLQKSFTTNVSESSTTILEPASTVWQPLNDTDARINQLEF